MIKAEELPFWDLCIKCRERPRRSGHQRWCNECHAENMRATRPKHSELTEEQRKRANARSYANTYKSRGKLMQENCKECGDPDSQMHHEDYDKPLDVIWLCRDCHLDLHGAK
jgi:hypothetical protein